MNIAYKTHNTIQNLLGHTSHNQTRIDMFQKSGVYQLECRDGHKKYIGQTGTPFYVRYNEHCKDFKHRQGTSKFAQHLLDFQHMFGKIDETMKILHTVCKGKMMNTLENFHIYQQTQQGNQINDRNTVTRNILFDVVISEQVDRGHP
jgi:hypothetical protein